MHDDIDDLASRNGSVNGRSNSSDIGFIVWQRLGCIDRRERDADDGVALSLEQGPQIVVDCLLASWRGSVHEWESEGLPLTARWRPSARNEDQGRLDDWCGCNIGVDSVRRDSDREHLGRRNGSKSQRRSDKSIEGAHCCVSE